MPTIRIDLGEQTIEGVKDEDVETLKQAAKDNMLVPALHHLGYENISTSRHFNLTVEDEKDN